MYIAGRLRTCSIPLSTLMESALYSPLVPSGGVIGVNFPFFVLFSRLGVLISLVAIRLRASVPILSFELALLF